MKYFKKEVTRSSERYLITPENFEKVTEHKYPFEKASSNGSISQYGVCPSCLNPIQLIGIVRTTKRSPYGKHTGKTIEGVASWNQLKYEYCPYAAPEHHREINEDDLLPEMTEDVIELYELLKNNFDRVVYVVQKAFDIQCSPTFWGKVLKKYLINRAYLYPWLTDANLPYILAMRGMTHSNIYGQRVKVGSELYERLKKHKYVNFVESNSANKEYQIITSKGGYLNLEFRFTGHRQEAQQDDVLRECVQFCVDDLTSGETVSENTIVFDETYFTNIINSDNKEQYRNQKLLDIAMELMVPVS